MAAASPNFDILIGGKEVPDGALQSYVVNCDLNQPDEAAIVLSNQASENSDSWNPGDPVEVKVGGGGDVIFKGELVGLEPRFQADGKSTILVRAFNKMHRLLRGRKSKTYQDKSDQDIFSAIASEHGLTADCSTSPKITHKHVYQHNMTDLEFIRMRAARLGFNVWCEDTKLMIKEPELDKQGEVSLSVVGQGKGASLRVFRPRMSNAGVLKKVTVRAWDPEKKEEIVGEASATSSPLGSKNAAASLSPFGDIATHCVDQPVMTREEANALAKAYLRNASLTYMTGEAECAGNAKLKLATVVSIEAAEGGSRFSGKYYIAGVTHRHTLPKAEDGGYVTILRLMRDAEDGK